MPKGLVTASSHRNQAEGSADQILDRGKIQSCLARKLFPVSRFRGRLTPSFKVPINGTTATPVRRINWWLLQILSPETIGPAHGGFF